MSQTETTSNAAPLWGGRFSATPEGALELFGASLGFDQRLWPYDIAGSRAHAKMLGAQEILSAQDVDAILQGLDQVAAAIKAGELTFDPAQDEDVHMAVERELTARIGAAGGRLHTGRSRNDQSVTDLRLFAKDQAWALWDALGALVEACIGKAQQEMGVVMPGYTHLQPAQPVLFSHHLLAYGWMFLRDMERMAQAAATADKSPLGAAALAGTTYPLDRFQTASELGMSAPIPNSMDAVADRDFAADLIYACSMAQMHLSRLCEELVIWSSAEFGFIEMDDAHSTGSSIMPQKKNPDFCELVRGKTGRVYGDLMSLLTVLKGLPLTYDKDLQEDKEPLFDAVDTVAGSVDACRGMIATMKVKRDAMAAASHEGYMAATDLADYLVGKGMPFREAHGAVGRLVADCVAQGLTLQQLTLDELRSYSPLFDQGALEAVKIDKVVAQRTTYGGTAPVAVKHQLQEIQQALDSLRQARIQAS